MWGRAFLADILLVLLIAAGCRTGSTGPQQETAGCEPIPVDSSPSWSFDGNFVYYRHEFSDSGDTGGIYKVEVYDGWREPVLLDGARRPQCPAASPTDPKLALVIGGDIHVLDLTREALERRTRIGGCANPDWSTDGSSLCFQRDDGKIWIETSDSLRSLRLGFEGQSLMASNPLWSPDGLNITFCGSLPTDLNPIPSVFSVDLQDMQVTRLFAPKAEVSCLDWSPLGGVLALSSTPDLSVSRWTRDIGGSPEPWFPGTEACWSMEGDRLVYVAPDMGRYLVLWLRDPTEPDSEPRQLTFGIGGFLAEEAPGRVSASQPESR